MKNIFIIFLSRFTVASNNSSSSSRCNIPVIDCWFPCCRLSSFSFLNIFDLLSKYIDFLNKTHIIRHKTKIIVFMNGIILFQIFLKSIDFILKMLLLILIFHLDLLIIFILLNILIRMDSF